MNGTAYDASVRSLFPLKPLRWLWARAKLYLSVILVCVAGFFFVAGWAAGGRNDVLIIDWTHFALWQIAEIVIVTVGARGITTVLSERWNRDNPRSQDQ